MSCNCYTITTKLQVTERDVASGRLMIGFQDQSPVTDGAEELCPFLMFYSGDYLNKCLFSACQELGTTGVECDKGSLCVLEDQAS